MTTTDFLSGSQIISALKIWRDERSPAKRICEEVIKPNIQEINRKLGQENEPMYLAYVCEYIFNESAAAHAKK